jgi:hypothetical protein
MFALVGFDENQSGVPVLVVTAGEGEAQKAKEGPWMVFEAAINQEQRAR